jgi:hypothetical protein
MMEGIAVLRTLPTREEAEILRGVLEANGITSYVVSDDARGLQPPMELVRGVKLVVAQADRESAEDALRAMEEGGTAEESD